MKAFMIAISYADQDSDNENRFVVEYELGDDADRAVAALVRRWEEEHGLELDADDATVWSAEKLRAIADELDDMEYAATMGDRAIEFVRKLTEPGSLFLAVSEDVVNQARRVLGLPALEEVRQQ